MYIKRLDLLGFKSFASKTSIAFRRGICAVVGPNGCGKSNVVDGIRWVLGESSARELRGQKMHDVIFAGAAERSPLNLAEVNILLDNEMARRRRLTNATRKSWSPAGSIAMVKANT